MVSYQHSESLSSALCSRVASSHGGSRDEFSHLVLSIQHLYHSGGWVRSKVVAALGTPWLAPASFKDVFLRVATYTAKHTARSLDLLWVLHGLAIDFYVVPSSASSAGRAENAAWGWRPRKLSRRPLRELRPHVGEIPEASQMVLVVLGNHITNSYCLQDHLLLDCSESGYMRFFFLMTEL